MSNSRAIAAVTATLRSLLHFHLNADTRLSLTNVTIQPLDRARDNVDHTLNQVNLFLYMIARNGAWVNADMPRHVKPGESAMSPLPLNLYYLVTPFGKNDDAAEPFGHELLGKAMSIFFDHPVLSAADIKAATAALLPDSDLDRQVEQLRITFQPLTMEDLSKLWSGFAMQYRLSAAYEVGVTLIESTRGTRTPLPILMRGSADSGFPSQADLTPPVPTLYEIAPPNRQPAARLGNVLTITGVHLDGTTVPAVRFFHPALAAPVEVAADTGGTSTTLSVTIPLSGASAWPAGFYTVEVLVERAGETFRRTTNQLTFALAPSLTIIPPITPAVASPAALVYTVTVSPDVRPEQRATLMLGDIEFAAEPHPAQTDTLQFTTVGLAAGDYWVRLRVDGVDSILVDRSQAPPAFDTSQKVTVT
jgi:hypothetical protein